MWKGGGGEEMSGKGKKWNKEKDKREENRGEPTHEILKSYSQSACEVQGGNTCRRNSVRK